MRLSLLIPFAFLGLLICPVAFAQTGTEMMMLPFDTGKSFEAGGEAVLFGSGHTDTPSHNLSLSQYDTQERWQIVPGNSASPVVGHELTYFHLQTDDPRLPSRMFDESIGIGQGIARVGDFEFALTAGVGYSGTNPFAESQSVYGKGSFIVNYNRSKDDGIVAYLTYDPSSTIFPDIPVPGIGYYNTRDPNLTYLLGLPFAAVDWKPTPRLHIAAQYQVPLVIDVSAKYEIAGGANVFAAYNDLEWAFRRQMGTDRIFLSQQRVEGGIEYSPAKWGTITVAGGYAFGTDFQTGFDDRNLRDITHVSDTVYVRIGIGLKF